MKFHEELRYTVRNIITGYQIPLAYGWVIPYAIFPLLIGLYYLQFLVALPIKTKRLFIIAGCIYVTGALGLEVLEVEFLNNGLMFRACILIEESFEIIGVIVFISALLDHLLKNKNSISIKIAH
jgi:hypothetical protein